MEFDRNDDGFIFDNQMLSQIIYAKFNIAEITCPANYFKEASSIGFWSSVKYGLGVVNVSIEHFLQRKKLISLKRYHSYL
jgi:hypothetical protein